jgi:adenosylhomocysteine nucleosidase
MGTLCLSQPGAAGRSSLALSRVGIVCALASEARHLGSIRWETSSVAMGSVRHGTLADGTLVSLTGMGIESATQGARDLANRGVAGLASFGMAGGLDPVLAPGDILAPADVATPDGRRFHSDEAWRQHVCRTLGATSEIRTDTLLTALRAVGTVEEKSTLYRTTGASAVDMESAAIAGVAAEHGLPFIAIRVIVDSATDVLPRSVTAAADAAGHLQVGRLIGALVLAPGELTLLARLAKRYRAASRSLAWVASSGVLTATLPTRASQTAA